MRDLYTKYCIRICIDPWFYQLAWWSKRDENWKHKKHKKNDLNIPNHASASGSSSPAAKSTYCGALYSHTSSPNISMDTYFSNPPWYKIQSTACTTSFLNQPIREQVLFSRLSICQYLFLIKDFIFRNEMN